MAGAGASTGSTTGRCSAAFLMRLHVQAHCIVPRMSGEEVVELAAKYKSDHYKMILEGGRVLLAAPAPMPPARFLLQAAVQSAQPCTTASWCRSDRVLMQQSAAINKSEQVRSQDFSLIDGVM